MVASVRQFACLRTLSRLNQVQLPSSLEQGVQLSVHRLCLCVCNQAAYADNLADAVDQLLIGDMLYK